MSVQTVVSSDAGSTLDMLDALASVVSTVVAAAALYWTARINLALRRQEQVNNIPRLYLDEYADGTFSSPIQMRDAGADVTLSTFKDARDHIRRSGKDAAARSRFLENSVKHETWENRVAYEFSLALQKLGASVFVGAIPLDFVLATGATRIIADWGYCHPLVERIRRDSPSVQNPRSGEHVEYHRRHGEWLAYVAAVWLHHTWSTAELTAFLDAVAPAGPGKGRERQQIKLIRDKLDSIQRVDGELLSDTTERQLRRILRRDDDG